MLVSSMSSGLLRGGGKWSTVRSGSEPVLLKMDWLASTLPYMEDCSLDKQML